MAKPKRITMLDVAREANVSYQTVSRVINEHPSVSATTRARVLQVIQQLNYRPSKVARSLATNRTRTLAVITYGMRHYGPTQMVVNIEQAAKQAGYDLILANVDPNSLEDFQTTIERIERWSVDGLLMIAPVKSNRYEQLVEQFTPLPLVQIDITPGAKVPSVIIAQKQGSSAITRHLLDLGHTRFCEISGPMNWYAAESRHEGFVSALHSAQLTPIAVVEGKWTPQSGYTCAQKLLADYQFSALVVGNDQMALGAMRAIQEHGMRIPEGVSIVGFDDIPEAPYLAPPLTTVHQDFSELGRQGIEQLLQRIQEPTTIAAQWVIPTTLILRDSTQAPY